MYYSSNSKNKKSNLGLPCSGNILDLKSQYGKLKTFTDKPPRASISNISINDRRKSELRILSVRIYLSFTLASKVFKANITENNRENIEWKVSLRFSLDHMLLFKEISYMNLINIIVIQMSLNQDILETFHSKS